jgi:hypothetical protein|tara:strand:- start:15 stop:377 length:363 start_codon:yes stop_codon:yes gene_type:complete
MLVDITKDIQEGKYTTTFSPLCGKVFGRRIFVKLQDDIILIGNIQYTINDILLKVIVYVNFNFRINRRKNLAPVNMIIKEYQYQKGVDLTIFMRRIRQELFEDEPQSPGFSWSFVAESLL